MPHEPTIRIKRSAARKKTISARLVDGGATIEVLAPAGATAVSYTHLTLPTSDLV